MKYFNKHLLIALTALTMFGLFQCQGSEPVNHPQKTNPPQKLKTNKTFIIDVRPKNEFYDGHIKDAINIPFYMIGSEIHKHVKDKDAKLILYCNSGNKAGIAQKILEQMGYTNIKNGRGYSDMETKGYTYTN